jgi:hypothetical protein
MWQAWTPSFCGLTRFQTNDNAADDGDDDGSLDKEGIIRF